MDKILILDFGGQYTHLISRRIRELGVYTEILPGNIPFSEINLSSVKGIILSGGPSSVYEKNSPKCDKRFLESKIPILGICYGHQLLVYILGGKIEKGVAGEYGLTELEIIKNSPLFFKLSKKEIVWMNHQDVVKSLPKDFEIIAKTNYSEIAAYQNLKKKIFGVQFHPEVSHTKKGVEILKNFVFKICQAKKEWQTKKMVEIIKDEIKREIGNEKALLALSGGIDSFVAAILVNSVSKDNLLCIYIDTGLMREEDKKMIKKLSEKYKFKLKIINAQKEFFKNLKGVIHPEEKRKIIGKIFIKIFERIAKREKYNILIQGTIYSDRIESGQTKYSSKIKSHHNVGGLPKRSFLKIYEPLRNLYKDEVRRIAKDLKISKEIIKRHIFPGPGFAIRIIGEVTPKKVAIVRKATKIIEEELKKANYYYKVWMAFPVLLSIKSVGIQGDKRSYKYPIVLRIVESEDAMTANFTKIPYSLLEKISQRLTNEIKEINRVVYDITNKPPATMEWE
ncbi:MAG: glutamine-hydrolyzing GMP synthase [candidate division WOR-3 bacterium]|nr:glutamine-hydrolyzing GMP synthase [candidate division WOR-3 bacterium]MCX7836853.1 glutamine-hydrolyzing GMP synthase [candidate division WOR-3 bacterium]MDW8114504.1 glutamine-hydrolyzing GMP synthase [candidate division WOR-3 bacterium]